MWWSNTLAFYPEKEYINFDERICPNTEQLRMMLHRVQPRYIAVNPDAFPSDILHILKWLLCLCNYDALLEEYAQLLEKV